MSVLKKQETLVQNIAYMGIMASVNVIFVIMTYFIPFLLFLLVFILPLCSAIISYYCKRIYFPIYLIAVAAICLLIDPADTIFYVIPSLITGFIYGYLIELKAPSIVIILIVTLIQNFLLLLSIPLIQFFTGHNIVEDMAKIFRINDYEYLDYVKYLFIMFVAFAQSVITYIVMSSELHKFGMKINNQTKTEYLFDIASILCVGLGIIMIFLLPETCYVFIFLAYVLVISRIIHLDFTNYKLLISEGIGIVFISIFLGAILYPQIQKPFSLMILGILPLLISLTCIVNYCLFRKRNKDTIN